jgi:hypothetical protein
MIFEQVQFFTEVPVHGDPDQGSARRRLRDNLKLLTWTQVSDFQQVKAALSADVPLSHVDPGAVLSLVKHRCF